jgi:hypothetical protein
MNNIYINQDSLYQQYQNLTTDFYALLQKEMETLTETEIAELSKFKPYIEANNKLGILVQAELLNLVKRQINANPEVIKGVIESVKAYKKERDKEMNDFQDYIKNYSDITYKEYKELKYENK